MVILCFVLTKNMLIFGCEAVLAKYFYVVRGKRIKPKPNLLYDGRPKV